MNIYKTKDRIFINMAQVCYITTRWWDEPNGLEVVVYFPGIKEIHLWKDDAMSFLDYLDNHLPTVYNGWS